jgi:hypothetical protein
MHKDLHILTFFISILLSENYVFYLKYICDTFCSTTVRYTAMQH